MYKRVSALPQFFENGFFYFYAIIIRIKQLDTEVLVGGGVNQAYSRLSTTHSHITDCKLDSVVYAGVCV